MRRPALVALVLLVAACGADPVALDVAGDYRAVVLDAPFGDARIDLLLDGAALDLTLNTGREARGLLTFPPGLVNPGLPTEVALRGTYAVEPAAGELRFDLDRDPFSFFNGARWTVGNGELRTETAAVRAVLARER